MNIEIICINSKFPPDYLEFYKLYGVVTPTEGIIYTPRSVSRNSNGDWEILLDQLLNPDVPIKHPILGVSMKEPAWKISRFSNLDSTEITEEQVKSIKFEEKHQDELILIKPKKDENLN